MLDNQTFVDFCISYQINRSDKELEKHFQLMKPYLKLRLYNDPSNTFDMDDIECLARYGFWQAVILFNPERSTKVFAWIYHIVRQRILGELKKRHRENHLTINSFINPDLDMENLEDSIFEDDKPIELQFELETRNLFQKIYEISPKAAQAFALRLAFPFISRKSIAKILGFKRRNGIAKLVKIMKACANRYLTSEVKDAISK